ncbi:MAG: DUF4097 family beta strand repeat protein [Gemmatimonadaceae bacterium]|nr:DUF4097 family beta strand repeat protein [Gemmatimonadaceae bacterium]
MRHVRIAAALLAAHVIMPHVSVAQNVVRGFTATSDVTMRLYIPAGALRIEAWDRDSVHVEGTLGSNASLFGGGARTHIKLGIEARSTKDGTLPNAELRVHVPRRARLWVKMVDGTLTVTGIQQELEAYTVRGRMDVRDVAGTISIESIDAPVTLARATGDVRIRGSRGLVTLEQLDATLSVTTVSGGVALVRSQAEGRIESIGGGIAIDGVRAGSTLELQSHSGTLRISVPPKRPPLLELSSRGGTVSDQGVRGDAKNGHIVARSFKGDVLVVRTP